MVLLLSLPDRVLHVFAPCKIRFAYPDRRSERVAIFHGVFIYYGLRLYLLGGTPYLCLNALENPKGSEYPTIYAHSSTL